MSSSDVLSDADAKNAFKDHERYEHVKDLGSGAFGAVQLCRDKAAGTEVAIKLIPRGPKTITKYVASEILNFRVLLHPHVVQLQEVFLTKHFLCFAMEYANGGDTYNYVASHYKSTRRGLSEPETRFLFQQLIVALDYCHRKGVVNRDLKLENTLLQFMPGRSWPLLKLCDFGYSKDENQTYAKSRVGTPGYMAPEVILNDASNDEVYDGKQADVWSAGVLLYVMLFARMPFERRDDDHLPEQKRLRTVLQRIVNVDFHFPPTSEVSEQCKHLVRCLLVAEPESRLTVQGIFNHPWFRKDLAPGALTMNDDLLESAPSLGLKYQSVEDIKAVLDEARRPVSVSK